MDEKLAKTIGSLVKAARQKRGLTQAQLAEKIAKAHESISNIERGFKPPAIQTLADISVALDMPLTDFFEAKLLEKPSSEKQVVIDEIQKMALSMELDQLQLLLKLGTAIQDD